MLVSDLNEFIHKPASAKELPSVRRKNFHPVGKDKISPWQAKRMEAGGQLPSILTA
jgi:hypothetical protein